MSLSVEEALRVVQERKRAGSGGSEKPFEPCTEDEIYALVDVARQEIGIEVPADYLDFLRITNTLWTQHGYLHGPKDFISDTHDHWRVTYTVLSTERITRAFGRLLTGRERKVPEYSFLGYADSVDQFIYRYATGRYQITARGDADDVYEDFGSLAELIDHIGRDE